MKRKIPILTHSTVLITGASSGIGYELAKLFALQASTLILIARRVERLERLATEIQQLNSKVKVILAPCDITDEQAVDEVLASLQSSDSEVDILVNCAGIAGAGLFSEQRMDSIEKIIRLNVTALVSLTRKLIPGMMKKRSGAILNFSSIAGLHAFPTMAVYTGSKYFVTGFSQCLREEVGSMGIVVSQVCCGPVDTEIWQVSEGMVSLKTAPIFTLSAKRCAQIIFDDFSRGKALIVPGIAVKFMLFLANILPASGLRLLQPKIWRSLRERLKASKFIVVLFVFLSFQSNAREPDPEKGYDFLVNGDYIGCGIPLSSIKRLDALVKFVPKKLLGLFSPMFLPPFMKDNPGIPGRKGMNAVLSHEFNAFVTQRGHEVINFNCLSCHSQEIGDQIIVGLGNTTRDYSQDFARVLPWLRHFYSTEAEMEEGRIFERRMESIAPFIITKTVGANPALNLSYALFSHRDPKSLNWSDTFVIDPPSQRFSPVRVPPWWRMRKRQTMYYNAEFIGTHRRTMMLASSLGNESVTDVERLDEAFRDVEAYIKTLLPPPYPHFIDRDLADRGQKLFNRACAHCHGTYGPSGSYVEKVIPIEVIQTDPNLMEEEAAKNGRFFDWIKTSYYGQLGDIQNRRGYVAPPLDGVWATAPYFHNGSVPTLEGVLDSTQRPKYFRRSFNPAKYDTKNMGWKFRESPSWEPIFSFKERFYYNTEWPGYSNGGHAFGDGLSQEERTALLEYLKTL